jgi:hypothetical protein
VVQRSDGPEVACPIREELHKKWWDNTDADETYAHKSSEDFETISLASVKEVKTTPISLAARHP